MLQGMGLKTEMALLQYAGSQKDFSRLQSCPFYGGNHPEWTKYDPFSPNPREAKFGNIPEFSELGQKYWDLEMRR